MFIDDLPFSYSSHSIGIIAVSCGEGLSFDDRVDYFSRILMTSSLVLIWSFSDPIHPLVCVYVIKYSRKDDSANWPGTDLAFNLSSSSLGNIEVLGRQTSHFSLRAVIKS